MSITASVSGSPITASVTESGASVAVAPVSISATVLAGIGPQGPSGSTGETGGASTLAELTDVQITAAAEGDVLRYNGSKWADHSELLLTDGGNF
jgi:hypothetical protein